jgi:hypothetical protein
MPPEEKLSGRGSGCVFSPWQSSGDGRVDADLSTPGRFITTAMELAMVPTAERHGELIADLAAQCRCLSEP